MLTSINLKRFKKFKSTTVELRPFTILMGENSSGKSTLLQAVNLSLSVFAKTDLYTIREDGTAKVRDRGIGMTSLPGMNISDYHELYYAKLSRNGQRYRGIDSQIGTVLELADTDNNTYRMQISSLFGGYNLKCLSKPSELRHNPVFCKYSPLFISGFIGLQSEEERSFPVAIRNRLATGDASTVIRNLVLDLKDNDPDKYKLLCNRLQTDFGFYLDVIAFDRQADQYITAHYSERCDNRKLSLDFNASGSGFMQILQILTPIYSFCPHESKLVLLDEPDAHLHPNLQTSLAKSLRNIQRELGIQIIVSTHSTNIIRSANATEVVPISSIHPVCTPLTSSEDVEQMIFDKLDTYELGKTIISGKLIFIEDKHVDIYEAFDKLGEIGCFSGVNTVPVITGRGKDDRIPFQINEILKSCMDRDIEIHFIRDGDGLSGEWRTRLDEYAQSRNVHLYQLERYEIENYILDPALILRAIKAKYPNKRGKPSLEELTAQIKGMLSNTISHNRYNYDDTLEDGIFKTANLLGISEYRNFITAKQAADAIRSEYETYTEMEDLLRVGKGKECFKQLSAWLNGKGFNLSKDDVIQVLAKEDVPEEIAAILMNFRSNLATDDALDSLPEIPAEDDEMEDDAVEDE